MARQTSARSMAQRNTNYAVLRSDDIFTIVHLSDLEHLFARTAHSSPWEIVGLFATYANARAFYDSFDEKCNLSNSEYSRSQTS